MELEILFTWPLLADKHHQDVKRNTLVPMAKPMTCIKKR